MDKRKRKPAVTKGQHSYDESSLERVLCSGARGDVQLGEVVVEALQAPLDALLVVERAAQYGGLEVLVRARRRLRLGRARVHVRLAARQRDHRVVVPGHY